VHNRLKEFLSKNFKLPTYSRWVVFFVGIAAEVIFTVCIQVFLHRDLSRFIPFFIGFAIYWFALLCARNVKNFLALSALFLFPFNRFLILRDEQAFILGRISDYMLLTLHLFEIPLYIYGCIRVFELIKNFRVKSLTVNTLRRILLNPLFFSAVIFVVSIASAVINNSLPESISRLQILVDFSLFYLILFEISYNQIFNIIASSAVIQSLIGILQVVLNSSIGLAAVGESVFNEGLIYISKSMIGDTLRVRAYGTFPHPNLLSGFLFIAFVIIGFYFVAGGLHLKSSEVFSRRNFKLGALLSVIILGLYLGQSRTVLLAIGLSLVMMLAWFIIRNFHSVFSYSTLLLLIAVITAVFIFVFQERINSLFTYDRNSFSDRISMQEIAIDAIRENPSFGLGPNGYLEYIGENKPLLSHFSFIVEPVHNVFLLVASETGVLSAVFFILYIAALSAMALRRNINNRFLYIVIPIVLYLLFVLNLDHYLLTLKQGCVLFAISLFLVSYERKKDIGAMHSV